MTEEEIVDKVQEYMFEEPAYDTYMMLYDVRFFGDILTGNFRRIIEREKHENTRVKKVNSRDTRNTRRFQRTLKYLRIHRRNCPIWSSESKKKPSRRRGIG